MEHLKYPIGKYHVPEIIDEKTIETWIAELEIQPERFKKAVNMLSEDQLNTSYRPDGWTARQVIHHVPDSHLNAYVRFKLALTEAGPSIKPYFEDRWAELPDTLHTSVQVSIELLNALHIRWVNLLRNLKSKDWTRTFVHPEYKKTFTLKETLGLYAWHGRHHIAHLSLIEPQIKNLL